ncbi:MAG: type II secretion system GspH family protein [Xanthomonadales bacterium]|nr:type II secretion system GspH family protein [Xanthomonadales bacterium]
MKRFSGAGRAQQSGFTLLEVLAAFVIFAVVFAALVQVLSGSIRNTTRSRELTEAAFWAQQYLDTLSLERPLAEGTDSGEFDDTYSYEVLTHVYEPQSVSGDLLEQIPIDMLVVELTVYWGVEPRQRQARFVTMRSIDRNIRESRELNGGGPFNVN